MSIQPTPVADEADAVETDAAGRGPDHVAIIMDGNGRWAAERGLQRSDGHRRGVEAVREVVRTAPEFGIRYLTLFGFSSENWSRPPDEVNFLLSLLRLFIQRDLADLHKHGVRVTVIGDRRGLPNDICGLLDEAEHLTHDNEALHLIVAFNYGGRGEIARAAARIARDAKRGLIDPDAITEETVAANLDTRGLPDPDLVIRTSGERRMSNFLLWQTAYSELVFLPCFWPDFDREALRGALLDYHRRDRRFGGLAAGTGG